MSQITIHNDTAYFAGQVARNASGEHVKVQTKAILDKIDLMLAEINCDKTKILSATIWLSEIADFEAMNSIWDAWVSKDSPPARACVESKLGTPGFNVEISLIAALD